MNLDFLSKWPVIENWLLSKVGYWGDSCYSIDKQKGFVPEDKVNKRIYILAKKNYSESWQTFSSIDKTELNRILKLKKSTVANENCLFQVFANKSIDGFDVKTITVDSSIINSLGKDKILIPESELLFTERNNSGSLQTVPSISACHTPCGLTYAAQASGKTVTAYAQGLMNNVETYKLSVGIPLDAQVTEYDQVAYAQLLIAKFFTLDLRNVASKVKLNSKHWLDSTQLHWLYGGPLLTAFLFYVVTNIYLAWNVYSLESTVGTNSGQVSELLTIKKQITSDKALIGLLSSEFKSQPNVHQYWNIVDALLENGMEISRITYEKGQLVARGSAEKASLILMKVSEMDVVNSATFDGAVRSSRGRENFTIQVIPKAHI
ncbi:hypothetical protein [Colwellia sp. MEBiC06753]